MPLRMCLLLAALVTSFSVSSAASSAAQQPAAGTLTGSVSSAGTGAPVRAEVTIDRPRRAVRTDSTGRFSLGQVSPGRVRLRVAAFGHAPADTSIDVRSGEATVVTLQLRAVPQSLAPVVSVAKHPDRIRFEEQITPSVVTISGSEVRRVPAIGEADVLRSVEIGRAHV